MTFIRTTALLLAATVVLLSTSCNTSTETGPALVQGNGSGVGVGLVSGMLYEPDGSTPAKGATLVVRDKNQTALVSAGGATKNKSALYTALTSAKGVFSFDTIADGLYIIEGSDNNGNMVLYDSLLIESPAAPRVLPEAKLAPAGTITGTIALTDEGNYLQVFILAFGVDRFSQVQADGSFTFAQLAAGTYTLKILSLDPMYETFDTAGIEVKSGSTTDIGTVVLPRRELQPVPKITYSHYDSVLTNVSLKWHALPDSSTAGYNIYRTGHRADEAIRLNGELLFTDTQFTDNTLYSLLTGNRIIDTVIYTVSMVDRSGNESPKSMSIVVPIVTAWEQYRTVPINIPQSISIYEGFFDNDVMTFFSESFGSDENADCNTNTVLRYSPDGTQLFSKTLPGLCTSHSSQSILFGSSDPDNLWILRNESPGEWTQNFDSLFVYALSSTGELTRQVRIAPQNDTSNFIGRGIVLQRDLYYETDGDEIRKINLDSGEDTPFLDLKSDEVRIRALVPGPDGGFIVGVLYIRTGTLEFYRHDCLFFDGDGNEIKRVSFSNDNVVSNVNDLGNLIASDGKTFYFSRYIAQTESDGSYSWNAMPLCRFSHPVMVRDDGTIAILSTWYYGTDLLFYRLKESNQQ